MVLSLVYLKHVRGHEKYHLASIGISLENSPNSLDGRATVKFKWCCCYLQTLFVFDSARELSLIVIEVK